MVEAELSTPRVRGRRKNWLGLTSLVLALIAVALPIGGSVYWGVAYADSDLLIAASLGPFIGFMLGFQLAAAPGVAALALGIAALVRRGRPRAPGIIGLVVGALFTITSGTHFLLLASVQLFEG